MNATTFDLQAAQAPIVRTMDGAFKLKLRDFTARAKVAKSAGREEYFYHGETEGGGHRLHFTQGANHDARTGWPTCEDAEIAITVWMNNLWNSHARPEAL